MARHRTQLTKERHILDTSATRRNESECPKTYPMRCNPLTRRLPKINKVFWGKAKRKNQNFAMKRFIWTTIHVGLFLQVSWKSLKQKWPKRCLVFLAEKKYFAPFRGAPGAIPPKILQVYSFFSPVALPTFVQIRPVSGKIYAKMSFRIKIHEQEACFDFESCMSCTCQWMSQCCAQCGAVFSRRARQRRLFQHSEKK